MRISRLDPLMETQVLGALGSDQVLERGELLISLSAIDDTQKRFNN